MTTVYQGFFDLKDGVKDLEFVQALEDYLGHLKEMGKIKDWRLLRRKLGLGQGGGREFQLLMEFNGLAQLDEAFVQVSERSEPIESLHHAVNSKVTNLEFGLYRDFPDALRLEGQERF